MELFRIEVKHEGTKVVARLIISGDAKHCDLMPGGRVDRVALPIPAGHCLTIPAELAGAAVESLVSRLRHGAGIWAAEYCGCPVHSEMEMEPLFDLVRGSSEGR